ncbi:putative Alpha/Beta hydrolase protein [Seiridium cardinale]|uniref:Alpha/Beta hydrolase protein n=1 Tax=Seiridium cardinale TaxID=138064 RepID=A0ABR2XE12_9PEZI
MAYNTLLALFTGFVASAAARQCQNLTVPLTLSARNGVFDIQAPETNVDVTNFILDLAQPGHNLTAELLTGYATISGTYEIAATYCEPDAGPGKALQVLTHGIGFDRSYWDFPANNYNYSYVNQALSRGYSTFSYDRLGIGQSQHGDPVNEIQSFLEVAALVTLTTALRENTIDGVGCYEKVVHIGHSFGSIETYGLVAQHPELSDAIILQGFSQSPDFVPYFELGGNFVQANGNPALAAYPDGYLAAGDQSAVQTNFFAPGVFDPAILEAAYNTGEPVTVGELLTIAGPASVLNTYPGPVLVVTGDRDIPFCGGNCTISTPSIPAMAQEYFANASYFDAFVVPGSGHGLNLEYTWPVTYQAMLDFFDEQI